MRSFDRLAKVYEPLERLSFGKTLEKARFHFLPQLSHCTRGLLIGDGDGRFSARLLESNQKITIDSIEISSAMIDQARERAGENRNRFRPIHADALQHSYPSQHYDFIGLHFSLDCFSQYQLGRLLPRLEGALRHRGQVVYTDFRAHTFWQRLVVRFLYFCFRASTGLATKKLATPVWSSQIQIVSERRFLKGLITSQLLQKT